jgi:hypothetical protein
MKAICIFLILSGLIFSCKQNAKSQSGLHKRVPNKEIDEKKDSVATALVECLPEFKNLGLRFKKTLNSSHHLALLITQRPESSFKFYCVQAGDDNPDRFEPLYNFYVNLKDSSVFFYDTVADSVLTMQQWRKSGEDDLLGQ